MCQACATAGISRAHNVDIYLNPWSLKKSSNNRYCTLQRQSHYQENLGTDVINTHTPNNVDYILGYLL